MRCLHGWNTFGSNYTGQRKMRQIGKRLLLAALSGPVALSGLAMAQAPNMSAPYNPVYGPPGSYQQVQAGPQMAPMPRGLATPQPLIIGPASDTTQFDQEQMPHAAARCAVHIAAYFAHRRKRLWVERRWLPNLVPP